MRSRAEVDWLPLGLFFALLSMPWWRHTDVGDAQVYQVIARHLAVDHRWISLRYLPTVHPRFFDHLPFGFWPMAALIRWVGEWSLLPYAALCSLGCVAVAGWVYATRTSRPASVVVAPGVLVLVPGSVGFRSIAALMDSSVVAGIDTAFSALLTGIALVVGLLVANVVLPSRPDL